MTSSFQYTDQKPGCSLHGSSGPVISVVFAGFLTGEIDGDLPRT